MTTTIRERYDTKEDEVVEQVVNYSPLSSARDLTTLVMREKGDAELGLAVYRIASQAESYMEGLLTEGCAFCTARNQEQPYLLAYEEEAFSRVTPYVPVSNKRADAYWGLQRGIPTGRIMVFPPNSIEELRVTERRRPDGKWMAMFRFGEERFFPQATTPLAAWMEYYVANNQYGIDPRFLSGTTLLRTILADIARKTEGGYAQEIISR